MAVTFTLAVALIALAAVLVWRERKASMLRAAAEQLGQIVRSKRFSERIDAQLSDLPLSTTANQLLAQLSGYQRQLKQTEHSFFEILDGMREAIAVHRDTVLFANERFALLAGRQQAADLVGQPFANLVPAEYSELAAEFLRRRLAGENTPDSLEVELQPGLDQTTRAELSAARIDLQGAPALLLTLVEMTPRAAAISDPQRSRSVAWETLDSLGEGVITTDAAGLVNYVNRAAEQLIGNSSMDAHGKALTDLVSLVDENDRQPLSDPVGQCLSSRTRVTLGRRGLMITRGGAEEHSIDLSAAPLKSQQGELVGVVVMLRDVSELRGLTRQMSYQASHDPLTGLVNRREFERRLQEILDSAHASASHHVLCYLDLDRFKNVNDTSGHVAGDNMLREVAALIKEAVRDSDTVGRLGGDEFGLLLIGCPLEKASQIAEDVVRKISDYRFVWKDKIFNIGVSIGLIEISHESGTLEEVMNAADSACYVAKKQGNHVHVYSARDEAVARQRGEIQWLQRLQLALKENRFELLAQPIVSVSKQLGENGPALEVLLRLQDDNVPGGIPPSEFLRAAERYRMMVDVDRWVVQTALTALGRGGIRLPNGGSLAINLSGQTLGDSQFLEFVVECIDHTGVAPSSVCFEVTENAVVSNIEQAKRFIGVLHGMGCRFALDDFGRGLSSLGNLKSLAIDYLKIDGSFIRNLAVDKVNQAVVAAMVKLARTLNFKVVAEQVEDAGALEAARTMGVDFVQGFQLGRPQPLARVVMNPT